MLVINDIFIGRSYEIQKIEERLLGSYSANLAIIGFPGVGKTNLIQYTILSKKEELIASKKILAVYANLSNYQDSKSVYESFITKALEEILPIQGISSKLLEELIAYQKKIFQKGIDKNDRNTYIERFFRLIVNSNYRLIYILDEFHYANHILKKEDFQFLRKISYDPHLVTFLLLSEKEISSIEHYMGGTSNFHQTFFDLYLKGISKEELEDFLDKENLNLSKQWLEQVIQKIGTIPSYWKKLYYKMQELKGESNLEIEMDSFTKELKAELDSFFESVLFFTQEISVEKEFKNVCLGSIDLNNSNRSLYDKLERYGLVQKDKDSKYIPFCRWIADYLFNKEKNKNYDLVKSKIAYLKEEIQQLLKDTPISILKELKEFTELKQEVQRTSTISFSNNSKEVDTFQLKYTNHFQSIQINSYKMYKGVEVKNLKRINIFAGINNSGKTSLLESIYILTKLNDSNSFFSMQKKRGKFNETLTADWISKEVNHPIIIEGIYSSELVKTKIEKLQEDDANIDKYSYRFTLSIQSNFLMEANDSKTRVYNNKPIELFSSKVMNLCNSYFSTPYSFVDQNELVLAHELNVKNKTIQKIIQFIKKYIDNKIEDIELAGEFQRFIVTHEDFSNGLDLAQFGEGMQRIFYISMMFALCKNGVILIDELENAIHFELLKDYSQFIVMLAEEFHVQVFITSHSKECIDSFLLYNDDYLSNISSYVLTKDSQGTKLKYIEGNRFSQLIKTINVDLRKGK